ncbi:short-subunit dehydrogenase [Arthrobacter sp. AG258]|uniref:SDR family NAD(P)-dependent oxidoreductase n=1 Tax=Arthrobacter sp. AG258 TaxID=2183899 RepID=UPI00105F5261|nr:SDR family NAD(P)-dependent oxidoreductase [Arthrobacter sp. AG258]TDT81863.1 short-subunit dehydrogenase [Arthrobacter sp. AG258]
MSEQNVAPSPTPAKGVALITGTSTGIGLATAVEAARAGWTTIATMRDLQRADALRAAADEAGVSLDIRRLDVTDAADIDREIAYCISSYGRLDVLVNNAGSAAVGTVEMLGLKDFRSAMEVNFFGVVALTRAALPHLRESGGRVVTISSVGGIVGQPFNEAYCAAKFAVEGFLESLQPVARTVGVGVHVIEPGAVSSNFVANARIDVPALLETAGSYTPAITAYLERTSTQFASSSAQQPADVAAVVLATMEGAEPAFRIQTSSWAHDFVATKLADLDGSRVTGLTAGWVAAPQE